MYNLNPLLLEDFFVVSKRVHHKGTLKNRENALKQSEARKSSIDKRISKLDEEITSLKEKLVTTAGARNINHLKNKIANLQKKKEFLMKLSQHEVGIQKTIRSDYKRMIQTNKNKLAKD